MAISRLRYFLLISMAVLIAVQALGKTQLSEETPEINSENLLVLRTFSKAFGAAGMRLGYGVAAPAISSPSWRALSARQIGRAHV